MLAEYCCSLIRDTLIGESKRQKKAKGVCDNFYSIQDKVHTDIVRYLTRRIVITNQRIIILL
jgi:hypothetical protein